MILKIDKTNFRDEWTVAIKNSYDWEMGWKDYEDIPSKKPESNPVEELEDIKRAEKEIDIEWKKLEKERKALEKKDTELKAKEKEIEETLKRIKEDEARLKEVEKSLLEKELKLNESEFKKSDINELIG